MKQKNIKVVYKSRSIGGSYTQVPKIQMELGMAGGTGLFHWQHHRGGVRGRLPAYPSHDGRGTGRPAESRDGKGTGYQVCRHLQTPERPS